MNLDWSNPVVLFDTLGGAGGDLGITYDSANNSIWVSGFNNSTVTDFALNGTVLSSFTGPAPELTSLAYDPSDGTLWMGSQTAEGTFWQFSTTGTQLQSQFYAALAGRIRSAASSRSTPCPSRRRWPWRRSAGSPCSASPEAGRPRGPDRGGPRLLARADLAERLEEADRRGVGEVQAAGLGADRDAEGAAEPDRLDEAAGGGRGSRGRRPGRRPGGMGPRCRGDRPWC